MTEFTAIDFETTNEYRESTCAVGTAQFNNGSLVEEYYTLIDPQERFSKRNIFVHGITPEDVAGKPTFTDIYSKVNSMLSNQLLVSHTPFDIQALRQVTEKYSLNQIPFSYFDSYALSRYLVEGPHHRLIDMANHFKYASPHAHNALEDAKTCGIVVNGLLKENNFSSIEDLSQKAGYSNFGINSADNFRKFLRTAKSSDEKTNHFNEILSTLSDIDQSNADPDGILFGKNIVFTGKLESMGRAKAAELSAKAGGIPQKGLTKKTNFLVVGIEKPSVVGADGKSSKIRKAEKINSETKSIEIIDERDFLQML